MNFIRFVCLLSLRSFIPAPDYSRESWMSVKQSMGLDFPNVSMVLQLTPDISNTDISKYFLMPENISWAFFNVYFQTTDISK